MATVMASMSSKFRNCLILAVVASEVEEVEADAPARLMLVRASSASASTYMTGCTCGWTAFVGDWTSAVLTVFVLSLLAN